ncbi:hypothetical protein NPA11_03225 [Mycoplasma sp. 1578d]|uniref:hypothetical protein n=1 Tax=Mycoplasma sp. 1578d TaxID=2967299 RepID=UPI00211C6897|nr:hypothetical protein [Mycoplasma sp. 1578d]UUM19755.1 hypothetical protein NPA11_03225 [Mycoplasma sp. 1578d]
MFKKKLFKSSLLVGSLSVGSLAIGCSTGYGSSTNAKANDSKEIIVAVDGAQESFYKKVSTRKLLNSLIKPKVTQTVTELRP